MTDKQLLELAAKAAGIELDWNIPPNSKTPWEVTGTQGSDDYGSAREWNPLTDDGDALRLAVRLGFKDYFGIEVMKKCSQASVFEPWEDVAYEDHNDDPYAATRRAIVRAAAKLGELK